MKPRQYYPFLPEVYSCIKKLYPSIEYLQQALNSSIPGEIWANQHLRSFRTNEKYPPNLIKSISLIANFYGSAL